MLHLNALAHLLTRIVTHLHTQSSAPSETRGADGLQIVIWLVLTVRTQCSRIWEVKADIKYPHIFLLSSQRLYLFAYRTKMS